MIITFKRVLGLVMLWGTLTAGLFGQQADRAIITGLVADTTGAAISDATVTIINETTAVRTVVTTSSGGNYSTPQLILGTYTVQAEKQGFRTAAQKGVLLESGANYRQDFSLSVGSVTESVVVTAGSEMVNSANAEVSGLVNEKYYHDLPVVASQDMRLPEALLYVQPGFVPVKLTNILSFPSGTGFMSRINGGQAGAVESYLDGASFGQGGNTNLTFESSPPLEAIAEMKVVTSNFSAQIGRTSGGLVSYTTKSGTPKLHGTLYDYLNQTGFNAGGETTGPRPTDHLNSYGFSVGGPVYLPKVYDGRQRTFFFFNMDFTHKTRGKLPNFGLTAPIDAFRSGDFSSVLNTASQLGVDALGRPIYTGEIYNPSTSRVVGGVSVRDGYGFDPVTGLPTSTANMIPAGDPLLSSIAAKYTALIPQPDLATTQFNTASAANDASIDDKTVIARVDHSFNNSFKMTTTVNWDTRPRITNCGQLGACVGVGNPPNTYIGNGYFQRIRDTLVHQQFDWIIRPTLFSHTTIAFEGMDHPNVALAAKQSWLSFLGVTGMVEDTGGPPQVAFSGAIPFSQLGESQDTANDKPHWEQFLSDLTWVKGKHTLKVGIDYRHLVFHRIDKGNVSGQYNFSDRSTGGYDATGNLLTNTGNSFASFLLGQVDNMNFRVNSPITLVSDYISPWVSDEFKVTPRLTLTLGLRWDYQTPETEVNNNLSTFDPNEPNPVAGGIPGAMIFAGKGAGRSGRSTFQSPTKDTWGPRFGFAYQVPGKVVNVVRGGYGIYYASVNMNQFAASPTIGFNTNPTAPNVTNGFAPAFFWDDGFPAANLVLPPRIDPSVANGTSPSALPSNSFDLPRYQNWSVTAERQIGQNILLDVSYIGNRGSRLTNSAASLGVRDNMNNPSVLSLGAALLNSDINSPAAQAAGIQSPYPGFVGNVAQALRPFPQYQNIGYWAVPTGSSAYNALEVGLRKRFSGGLQAQFSYTWSKFMTDTAEYGMAGLDPGPQNPLDPHKGEWARSQDNVPQTFILSYTYELPFGKGKPLLNMGGPLNKVVGGWKVSGVQRYEAGRPLAIFMNNDLGGFLFSSTKRPNKVGSGLGNTSRGMNPATDRYLNASGFADPGPLQFGAETRTDATINTFPYYTEDLNFIKDTKLYQESVNLRFEGQMTNILNRHTWCDPNTNWSSPSFGVVSGQCDQPRRIQFGLKLEF